MTYMRTKLWDVRAVSHLQIMPSIYAPLPGMIQATHAYNNHICVIPISIVNYAHLVECAIPSCVFTRKCCVLHPLNHTLSYSEMKRKCPADGYFAYYSYLHVAAFWLAAGGDESPVVGYARVQAGVERQGGA